MLSAVISWAWIAGLPQLPLQSTDSTNTTGTTNSTGTTDSADPSSSFLADLAAGLEHHWLDVVVVVGVSILLAWAIRLASRYYLEGDRAETSFGQAAFEELHTPLSVSIVLFGIGSGLLALELSNSPPLIPQLIGSVLVVLWGRAAIRIGRRWIDILQDGETSYEFAPMFGNLWTITVVLVAGLVLISIWNLDLTPLLASAGIAGIVIGLAAQDTIGNLIGGVALYFDDTYKIGDVIRVDAALRGTVTDIGIRSTTVLTEDNLLVTAPNAILNSTQVVNESAPQRHMRLQIPITAAYGSDHERVEELVLEACAECPLVRDRPAPRLLFAAFGESALEFELQVYVNHPLARKRAIDQVNRGVYEAFDEADVTIPFPQRELSFLDDDAAREFRFDEGLDDGIDDEVDDRLEVDSAGGGRADASSDPGDAADDGETATSSETGAED